MFALKGHLSPNMVAMERIIIPVSYTHLDVYKRQLYEGEYTAVPPLAGWVD